MYAIIRTGGKQYTVKPGDILRVEKLDGELGAELKLTDILCVGGDKTFVGAPTVDRAIVTVVVTNQQRGPKLVIFKKKRRQGYRRMGGHRQHYTELFIKAITSPEGTTENASTQAQVFSPEKKAAKLAKAEEVRLAQKQTARKVAKFETVSAAPKAAAKKKVVKKTAAKKPARKKTAAKKVVKKATKKAASKK
jgi:large subunit ribosomal protein L21